MGVRVFLGGVRWAEIVRWLVVGEVARVQKTALRPVCRAGEGVVVETFVWWSMIPVDDKMLPFGGGEKTIVACGAWRRSMCGGIISRQRFVCAGVLYAPSMLLA